MRPHIPYFSFTIAPTEHLYHISRLSGHVTEDAQILINQKFPLKSTICYQLRQILFSLLFAFFTFLGFTLFRHTLFCCTLFRFTLFRFTVFRITLYVSRTSVSLFSALHPSSPHSSAARRSSTFFRFVFHTGRHQPVYQGRSPRLVQWTRRRRRRRRNVSARWGLLWRKHAPVFSG